MSDLARYVYQSRHLKGGRLRWQAFHPSRESEDLSVFDIRDADVDAKEALDEEVATFERGRPKGRAELPMAAVEDAGLEYLRDDIPIARHANLRGFPVGGDEIVTKAARTQIAQVLALRATIGRLM